MESTRKFNIGDRVRKHSGSWWEGRVVGFYSTEDNPLGYCVQMDIVPNGPVQIYPEAALEAAPYRPTIAELERAIETAYGILWRDAWGSNAAFDARKELLKVLDKSGHRRGIDTAISRYGPMTEREIAAAIRKMEA